MLERKNQNQPQFSKCPRQLNSLSAWNKSSTHVMATAIKKKKRKKKVTFWAHVHWYNRSTRLVTVSGTYTHRAPEAQEVV